ncbi:hypothetical protein MG293_006952 [Ovis ammon polii]|uniref:Serine/threonine-protein phosphatase with EF-hands n=1 Tax=Ovis ammon polii TaxID=230172 RepID=A0AAD4UB80_OVIAM|nr:hypothetical protein MG293_006952 [Ovis ammon polii]KAI4572287.1 hypothetical protein MJT46_005355 [Ovis ammon polii x Ovis aries]
MGSGTSTQHHFAFQNAEKAFRAAALIQRWYRRYVARLEMRRRCTWSIFQSIEYAGQQDQVKLHNFFSYLVDHFTPSSHNEISCDLVFSFLLPGVGGLAQPAMSPARDFLNRMFTEEQPPQASEMQNSGDYESIERLHARYVLNLLHEARKHLVQLPNINRVSTCYSEEITVCERAYVFNGDFVDRGKDSVEILMVLFAFMLVYPKEFHLNRGNHEDHIVNLRYGFTKEVMHKYKIHGKKILKLLQDVFCWLPLATLVDEKVLILHGGVSDRTDLELLAKLDRHKIVSTMRYKTRKENKKQAEEKGNANQTGSAGRPSPWFLPQSRSLPSSPLRPSTHKTHRAGRSSSVPCGVPLDPKELSRRVRHSVDLELERCRQQAGFPAIKEKEEPSSSESEVDSDAEEPPQPTPEEWRQVVDILWSDPMAQEGCRANTVRGGGCYFGPNVTEQLLQKYNLQFLIRSHECKPEGYEFCHSRKVLTIFSASNYYEVGSNRGAYVKLGPDLTPHIMQISRVEESALRALREKLFAHSSDILVEFKKHDKDETGLITLSDWAAAVESVLHLGLPWRMLRPQLVSSLTDNKLAYKSWLENLAKEKLSQQNIQSSLLETLYRNRSNLETIFRIIDSDHSDDCICDLARSIDFNKDGHIDINEFLEAFRLVEQSCSGADVSDCPQVTNSSNSDCSSPGTRILSWNSPGLLLKLADNHIDDAEDHCLYGAYSVHVDVWH